jgi:hypothetical protein
MATIKEQQARQFVKLSDLTKDYVSEGLVLNEFQMLPIKFVRSFAKNSGREQVSLVLKIHEPQLQQVTLKNGVNYITPSFFHKALMQLNAKYKDAKGQDIKEWNFKLLCRFVKGAYSNREGEYYSIEVIIKQGSYLTHFFNNDEVELFNILAEKKEYTPLWLERPDKIEEPLLDSSF